MKAKEVLASLTGISIPIFGIQWQPPVADIKIARDLIRELEDRRVLFREEENEGASYCVSSVDHIRSVLTASIKHSSEGSELYKRLQKMRNACRKFCDALQSPGMSTAAYAVQKSVLKRELIKLRSVFGLCVGELSVGYDLDVDDELATIIPFKMHT